MSQLLKHPTLSQIIAYSLLKQLGTYHISISIISIGLSREEEGQHVFQPISIAQSAPILILVIRQLSGGQGGLILHTTNTDTQSQEMNKMFVAYSPYETIIYLYYKFLNSIFLSIFLCIAFLSLVHSLLSRIFARKYQLKVSVFSFYIRVYRISSWSKLTMGPN